MTDKPIRDAFIDKYPEEFGSLFYCAAKYGGAGWDSIACLGDGEKKTVDPKVADWVLKYPKAYAKGVMSGLTRHCPNYANPMKQFDGIMALVNKDFLKTNPDFRNEAQQNVVTACQLKQQGGYRRNS